MQKIVDLSEHNEDVDFEAIKSAGYHCIIRCGYGQDQTNQDDKKWLRNVSECERLKIPFGVYLYSYAKNESMSSGEADHVLRLIKGHDLAYPIYYDLEEERYRANAAKCARAFVDKIMSHGYPVGVYANADWWKTTLKSVKEYNGISVWLADWYVSAPSITCDIWQYTDRGAIKGCGSNKFDLNYSTNTAETTDSKYMVELASEVIAGVHGNGDKRKKSLGNLYEPVQALVNLVYGYSDALDKVAKLVINGRYGNGDARKRNLGRYYDQVQKRVNQLLK